MANVKITDYPVAPELETTALFDVSQDSGSGLRSESVTPADVQTLLGTRSKTETASAGSNVVTFTTPYPAGTTVNVVLNDDDGIGLGKPTSISVTGFTVEAGLAGTFTYIAAPQF